MNIGSVLNLLVQPFERSRLIHYKSPGSQVTISSMPCSNRVQECSLCIVMEVFCVFCRLTETCNPPDTFGVEGRDEVRKHELEVNRAKLISAECSLFKGKSKFTTIWIILL